MNQSDLLRYAVDNGIIDITAICNEVELKEEKRLLKKHKFKIYVDKKGKYCTYLPTANGGRVLKRRNTKGELEELIVGYYRGLEESPQVATIYEEWIADRVERKKISLATRDRNRSIFNKHFGEFGSYEIRGLTPDDLNMFLEGEIPKHDMTAKAFSNLKGITKGIFKYAKRKGLIWWDVENALHDLDVSDRDFRKVIKEDYEEVYTDEEMQTIMSHCVANKDDANLALLLIFVTGMRIGEICTLKHEDVFEDRINVRRTETRYKDDRGRYRAGVKDFPKSSASVRSVIIPKEYAWLARSIRRLNPFEEWVFMYRGERMREKKIEDRLRWLCKKYNIIHKSPHKIRKTYISILLDSGVDNRTIQDQVGHADISVSENFYHRNRKKIEQKQAILSAALCQSNVI